MTRDVDIQIAQALGWTDIIVSDDTGRIRLPLAQWRADHPDQTPIYVTGRSPEMPDWPSSVVPHYEEDIAWLEDEVERRGLQHAYINALIIVVEPDVSIDDLSDALMPVWRLLRAAPGRRAQAFLRALT